MITSYQVFGLGEVYTGLDLPNALNCPPGFLSTWLTYLFKSYRAKKMKVIVTHYIVEREEYTEYSDRD